MLHTRTLFQKKGRRNMITYVSKVKISFTKSVGSWYDQSWKWRMIAWLRSPCHVPCGLSRPSWWTHFKRLCSHTFPFSFGSDNFFLVVNLIFPLLLILSACYKNCLNFKSTSLFINGWHTKRKVGKHENQRVTLDCQIIKSL